MQVIRKSNVQVLFIVVRNSWINTVYGIEYTVMYKDKSIILCSLQASHYQFSISWSRVLPDGTLSSLNDKGIQYYRNLVNKLHNNGIKPFVTLHHLDLPQALEDHGGWKNATTVDHFVDFARLMFTEIGSEV